LSRNSTCFGQFVYLPSGVYSLYTQQWYMPHRFVDSSLLVLLQLVGFIANKFSDAVSNWTGTAPFSKFLPSSAPVNS